ncbi:hemerythrin domain-containing protein [Halopseudomonas bauzanensis]|uniref:Hemerythrin domain-containing protein n=1 Tax=Halopseudomonas bauzanensis TaxID=653930 RepID=A0A4U0YSP3_9GAMM|nr:hemerythrin domain-containing protein [Halopseudomonas bauzanensis]TKA93649.1 hemerythrin domain-containing protein [Halopseudomonas bauzanensis]
MDAIELLKADHETVKQLLEEISATTERAVKKREELLQKIKLELTIHTTIEEEDFYPAFKEAGAKDELKMYHEAKEEHRAVESLVLPDLLNTEPGSVEFSGRIKVLKELLEHHIEEEEQEIFTDAAKLMSKEQLETLGKQMEEKKNNLKKAA